MGERRKIRKMVPPSFLTPNLEHNGCGTPVNNMAPAPFPFKYDDNM